MPASADATKVDWLRLAIQCVATVEADSVILGEPAGWGAKPSRAKIDPARLLLPRGVHAHDIPEVCIAIRGSATLAFDGKVYPFSPPRVALIRPGVHHAEGYARRQSSYAIMWMHYCSDRSLITIVSEYRPAGGWHVTARYALRSRGVQRLLGKLSGGVPASAAAFEPIRADLLNILTEMNRRNAYGAVERKSRRSEAPVHDELLKRVRDYLDHNFATPIDVHTVAALTRLTPNYLNSLFSRSTGQGIHEYLISLRMRRAMELCRHRTLLVKEVARTIGYSDPLYFSRAFRRYHGCWPTDAGAAVGR